MAESNTLNQQSTKITGRKPGVAPNQEQTKETVTITEADQGKLEDVFNIKE